MRSRKTHRRRTTKGRDRGPALETTHRCHYCNAKGVGLTRDHIVPVSRGGVNASWNIVYACQPCNRMKANEWPTCRCAFCRSSITKHISMGVTKDLQHNVSKRVGFGMVTGSPVTQGSYITPPEH